MESREQQRYLVGELMRAMYGVRLNPRPEERKAMKKRGRLVSLLRGEGKYESMPQDKRIKLWNRWKKYHDNKFPPKGFHIRKNPIFLESANLRKIDLRGADFKYVLLAYADLSGSNLEGAKFRTADWSELRNANFKGSYYGHEKAEKPAYENTAKLVSLLRGEGRYVTIPNEKRIKIWNRWKRYLDRKGYLDRKSNHKINLCGEPYTYKYTDLTGTKLKNIDLEGLCLENVTFKDSDLSWANLIDVDANYTIFSGAKFARANLTRAKLAGANFYKAKLAKAYLSRTDLTGANLTYADMTGATVEEVLIRDSKGDEYLMG
jgi:uncharacterized protein YjbI with pentapeptide repeats